MEKWFSEWLGLIMYVSLSSKHLRTTLTDISEQVSLGVLLLRDAEGLSPCRTGRKPIIYCNQYLVVVMFPLAVEELAELLDSDFDPTDSEVLEFIQGLAPAISSPL